MYFSEVGLKNEEIRLSASYIKIKKKLIKISDELKQDIFIMSEMLVDEEKIDEYNSKIIVAIKNYKILIIDFSKDKNDEEIEGMYEDFIDDLEYYSKKYSYNKILGRKKKWENLLVFKKINEIQDIENSMEELKDPKEKRRLEVIYSLITSNINDPERIGKEIPETILEKVKKNIISFDTDQAKFLFGEEEGKLIKIQGLAGTGKTELLLRKLKEVYVEGKTVVLTCHNEVLADSLRKRIPRFFNFLKVNIQIDPDKLKCFRGWGNKAKPETGLYSFICDKLKLRFYSLAEYNNFETVCKKALEQIEELDNFEPLFDYMLLDEAQDFGENFIKLCKKITKEKVYVAGDVFQSIFEINSESKLKYDNNYLLKKCYRTDPKTLSYAHALSLGLYEDIPAGWLSKEEWESCGYNYNLLNNEVHLKRSPVNRFNNLELEKTFDLSTTLNVTEEVIEVIKEIRKNYPDVTVEDIGIMFQGTPKKIETYASDLRVKLFREFKYMTNFAYETREKINNQIFLSTQNHTKGLEFSFVICILITPLEKLNKKDRNALYMMLTRSFLTSYLIVKNQGTGIDKLKKPLKILQETEELIFKNRSGSDLDEIKQKMIDLENVQKSNIEEIEEIVEMIAERKKLSNQQKIILSKQAKKILKGQKKEEFEKRIELLAEANF